jgi:hypothetical protein
LFKVVRRLIRVEMQNSRRHEAFDLARDRFANRSDFLFVENEWMTEEPPPSGSDLGDDHHPSWRVQRHTRDLVTMLAIATTMYSPRHLMFMEDDFWFCPSAIDAILHLINKADRFG